ncbi:hypothetical protein [Oscillatoria sp. FACHB-1406]|uniref:hypothetical protein n=1 Tax=Oscillatoria sp. FACHB-1406 TaxID=2692846 RepID=UPI00168218E1|nr:hypothetical protein [Oscillatoria sp. FACHB-1406]MBD2579743.1 hypothetical protein [Oscillatoria sp. FACHB-1406]
MQKTAPPAIDLVALEQLCQQQLQERFPQMVPLQARCYLREGTLVLTIEHHPPVLAYPHQAFRLFEQLLKESGATAGATGLIYLRMQGQQQPYAFHIVKVKSPTHSAEDTSELAAEDEIALDDFEELPEARAGLRETPPEADSQPSDPPAWLPIAMWGTGFGLSVFLLSLYLLSRPCVLRGCPEITFARQLAQQSLETANSPPSGQAIIVARQQFDRSLRMLRSIPSWSGYRNEAQALLAEYEQTARGWDSLVSAMTTAARAGNVTQNPPLPPARWEEAQQLWQEAIAQLQSLSGESEFGELVQRKLGEYQRNLGIVEQGLALEREARENLSAAKEMAKTAEVRQQLATDFEQLRLAETMWEQVSSRLQSVPKTSTAYTEAQDTLRGYLPQISAVRDRRTQENAAKDDIAKAEQLGKNAKASENANQWSAAVISWREAISILNKISEQSFFAPRAKALTKTYSTELSQAEAALQTAMKLQQIRTDLAQLCTQNTKICNFTVDQKVIQVYLTPTYVYRVRTSAATAQSKRDAKTQVQLLEHVYGFERALNAISDRAGLPLVVYNGSTVVQTHQPVAGR